MEHNGSETESDDSLGGAKEGSSVDNSLLRVTGVTKIGNQNLARKRDEERQKQTEALAFFLAESSVTEAKEKACNEAEKQEANQLSRTLAAARKAMLTAASKDNGKKPKKTSKGGKKAKGGNQGRGNKAKGGRGRNEELEEEEEVGVESRGSEEGSTVVAVTVDDNESIATVVIDPALNTEEEDSEEEVRSKTTKRQKVVPDKPSEMAMKAAKGNRAGIQIRSDALGCDHWGIMDMFTSGKILPRYMEHYLSEGEFLNGKNCKGCRTPASELEKTKCDPVERVYCYVCDEGLKGEVECDTFYCYPCMNERKEKLEEGNGRRGRSSRRS